ncbi:hypothetical protein [Tannerella forsythia]|uniref:hypothetical protein n=1 Tax=Tannerella forsythia TaxID=28112 RepID=UPI00163AF861|nr:hypothetical protein [Tannerella forsythia]
MALMHVLESLIVLPFLWWMARWILFVGSIAITKNDKQQVWIDYNEIKKQRIN